MGQTTDIAYCDSTVNPVVGCMGCELFNADPSLNYCYAATLVNRYAGLKGWPSRFTRPEFFPGRLERALSWPDLAGSQRPGKPWLDGYPRVVFLNDLGDTFAPNSPAPETWLLPRLDAMSRKHIWLLLTKWPRRMRQFFERAGGVPSNFWLGTSVTSVLTSGRLVELTGISEATVLWASCEPLLGELSVKRWLGRDDKKKPSHGIDWVVAGGESGRKASPMHPDWARALRDECRSVQVPYFFKQWGEFLSKSQMIPDVHCLEGEQAGQPDDVFIRPGKRLSGDILDVRMWHQMPTLPSPTFTQTGRMAGDERN